MLEQLFHHTLLQEAESIWVSGGWAMIPLTINAILLFAIGFRLWLRLRSRGRGAPEAKWRRWLDRADERRGTVGRLIDFVMDATDLKDMTVRFAELHSTELGPFDRDLKFMRRTVSTAPLLGLLGTVTGMLSTFGALASGSGGEKTMSLVASGISEALITTETGLVIALPGLFFQYHLARQRDRYEAFLAHLETVCTQKFYRSIAARRSGAAA